MSNTELLYKRFIADGLAAGITGFCLAPIITPMDVAVTVSLFGRTTIVNSIKNSLYQMVTQPVNYILKPEFGVVYGVISLTYLTRNVAASYCLCSNKSAEETGLIKFWSVLIVNGGLCVLWRDPKFSTLFGTKTIDKRIPFMSYLFWISRDVVHTLGIVIVPDYLESRYGLTEQQWRINQVLAPLLTQFINVPCHLFGLDYYNKPNSKFINRLQRIGPIYFPTVITRSIRMFPAWSIGLVVNREILKYTNNAFHENNLNDIPQI